MLDRYESLKWARIQKHQLENNNNNNQPTPQCIHKYADSDEPSKEIAVNMMTTLTSCVNIQGKHFPFLYLYLLVQFEMPQTSAKCDTYGQKWKKKKK